nr:hypothetical protein CFP56_11481 [Quercus suber]
MGSHNPAKTRRENQDRVFEGPCPPDHEHRPEYSVTKRAATSSRSPTSPASRPAQRDKRSTMCSSACASRTSVSRCGAAAAQPHVFSGSTLVTLQWRTRSSASPLPFSVSSMTDVVVRVDGGISPPFMSTSQQHSPCRFPLATSESGSMRGTRLQPSRCGQLNRCRKRFCRECDHERLLVHCLPAALISGFHPYVCSGRRAFKESPLRTCCVQETRGGVAAAKLKLYQRQTDEPAPADT